MTTQLRFIERDRKVNKENKKVLEVIGWYFAKTMGPTGASMYAEAFFKNAELAHDATRWHYRRKMLGTFLNVLATLSAIALVALLIKILSSPPSASNVVLESAMCGLGCAFPVTLLLKWLIKPRPPTGTDAELIDLVNAWKPFRHSLITGGFLDKLQNVFNTFGTKVSEFETDLIRGDMLRHKNSIRVDVDKALVMYSLRVVSAVHVVRSVSMANRLKLHLEYFRENFEALDLTSYRTLGKIIKDGEAGFISSKDKVSGM